MAGCYAVFCLRCYANKLGKLVVVKSCQRTFLPLQNWIIVNNSRKTPRPSVDRLLADHATANFVLENIR